MADIDQIIAGGAGASSRADFSGIGQLADAYYKARDEAAKNDLRDAFKNGVPLTPDGQPDFGAMAKTLFQKGGLDQGVAASNLDIQRQGIQQNREGANFVATGQTGDQPQTALVSPPSINRSGTAVVAAPLNKGGTTPQQGSPQGDQPGSIVGLVSSAGIPDELAGPVIQQVSAMTRTDPNATLDPQVAQRVQQVVQAAAQRMKAGQPQGGSPQPQMAPPPQGAPQQPQPGSTVPMVPTPVSTQAIQPQLQPQAPSPFANAVATGLIPPGVDPARFVAGLKYRAAALPKGPAQEAIQSQVNAIDKATELTQSQRDYNASHANPGLNDYQNQQAAEQAQAKGTAEANVKEQNDLISDGKMASKRLTTLNTISNIISSDKNITFGFGAETALKVKLGLQQMGINVGDLSGPQAIQKLNAALASESTKSISPRPAQFEFKTFLGNNPGLSLDKAGNERVIGIFSQLAKRDVDIGRLARQNRDNWENWDSVVENYDKQHPIKDPTSGKVITTDSIVAPGPKTGGKSNSGFQPSSAQAASPPVPGARLAPDNNWYVSDPNRPGKFLKVVQ
jgi:hypothetical protein